MFHHKTAPVDLGGWGTGHVRTLTLDELRRVTASDEATADSTLAGLSFCDEHGQPVPDAGDVTQWPFPVVTAIVAAALKLNGLTPDARADAKNG